MKSRIRVALLNKAGEVFADDELIRLLSIIAQHGSINHAAKIAGMSYMKAVGLLNRLEASLSFPVLTRKAGGRGGGGARLTAEGHAFIQSFIRYQQSVMKSAAKELGKYLPGLKRQLVK